MVPKHHDVPLLPANDRAKHSVLDKSIQNKAYTARA